jgi:YD repeat-containing protein
MSDGTTQTRYTYTYDLAGNPTQMREDTGDFTQWGYDSRSQLTSEERSGTGAYAYTYSYDAAGNRLTKAAGAQTTTYTMGTMNQVETKATGADVTTYTYSSDGTPSVVEGTVQGRETFTTYTYDVDERLVKVDDVEQGAWAYTDYEDDHDRRRITRSVTGSQPDVYYYDGEDVAVEDSGGIGPNIVYTHGPTGLVSRRQGTESKFYQFDALGSARKIITAAEAVDAALVYDGWGNIESGSAGADAYLWVGRRTANCTSPWPPPW